MAARFVQAKPSHSGVFLTSIEHTRMGQRETLEAIILNLANALGVTNVARVHGQRGIFYSVQPDAFQSATNTILSLSARLTPTKQNN